MFVHSRNPLPTKLEEEFSKPVESIMRCEDFKSNFARRLSNRYISRVPVSSPIQDTTLKLQPLAAHIANIADTVPERIELGSQLSKKIDMEQNGEAVKPPDKQPAKESDIRKTEVTVLNREVETLRWQLTQTEANRQMHITLLKQIVSFLNRVKEHIECQNNESELKKGLPTRLLPRSFNLADLPRSRSVVHVNKNVECFLTTPKKITSRKISKSISNVNGLKDCNMWNHSKLSLTSELDISQKISEEMSRLITLANTVLSTKIPDLAYTCTDKKNDSNLTKLTNDNTSNSGQDRTRSSPESNTTLDQIAEDPVNFFVINTDVNAPYASVDPMNSAPELEVNFDDTVSLLCTGLENVFPGVTAMGEKNTATKERAEAMIGTNHKNSSAKRNDFNCSSFIEDESGFSSMSSFQEIGIPIISIIPPSPCKEIDFREEITDMMDDADKWKTDATDLEKQTVKVFWV